MERLQKYLSSCGVASRRKSEELILKGHVRVNDEIVSELGFKISEKDKVYVDDVLIKRSDKLYYLLYKPEKVICSVHDEKGRTTVIDLIDTEEKIFPVGRLDYDTSGLLLLTNDGELSNKLTHPSGHVPKTYSVKAEGIVTMDELRQLEKGIILDGVKTKKAHAKIVRTDKKNNKTYIELTIIEERKKQEKKIFNYINNIE